MAVSKSSKLEDIEALFGNLDKVARLPNDVVPSFYRLIIKPNFTSLFFIGNVSITISTKISSVNQITLHSKNLEIFNDTILIEQNIVTSYASDTELILNRIKRGAVPQNIPKNIVIPLNGSLSNEISSSTTDATKVAVANTFTLNITNSRESSNLNAPINEQKSNMDNTNNTPIVTQVRSEYIKITSVEKNSVTDTVTFNLESSLRPNVNYTLSINFKGKIDDSLSGFYRSIYRDANNKTK